MKRKLKHLCSYCHKERERCKIVMIREVDNRPEAEYCCPSCWIDGEMDMYLYEKERIIC
jgi:hypothetical protein